MMCLLTVLEVLVFGKVIDQAVDMQNLGRVYVCLMLRVPYAERINRRSGKWSFYRKSRLADVHVSPGAC